MSRVRSYGPSAVLMVVMAVTLLGGPYMMRELAFAEQDARLDHARAELRDSPLVQLNQAFRDVAKAVEPSVVHIQVSRKAQLTTGGPGFDPDMMPDDLRRFFRERYGLPAPEGEEGEDGQPGPRSRRQPQQQPGNEYDQFNPLQPSGSGSGWIYQHIRPDGAVPNEKYIITNNHVVEDADQVLVKFYDKTERVATVVGTDPQTDIAVLRVDNGSLHPAKLSNQPAEQGDLVFAFGSPFRYEFSMSQGLVSGTSRQLGILANVRGYEDFIQTDAAINPGNSGGPLTNIYGEVIGMNSAIATRTGAFNGIGFAIPANMIRNVVSQIIEEGKVSRGFLGVMISDVDAKMAKSFDFDGKGVLVDDVAGDDTPAAKAGVRGGDIVTEVNGKPVTNATELRSLVAMYPPGEVVKVKVFREGEYKMFNVTLGELPKQIASARRMPGGERGADNVDADKLEPLRRLGFEKLSTLTKEVAEENEVQADSGVLIESVRSGSVAELEGLGRGMVIIEIMGKPVTNLEGLAEEIGKIKLTEGVRMRVLAGATKRFIYLELPEHSSK